VLLTFSCLQAWLLATATAGGGDVDDGSSRSSAVQPGDREALRKEVALEIVQAGLPAGVAAPALVTFWVINQLQAAGIRPNRPAFAKIVLPNLLSCVVANLFACKAHS
jgi:hypothetical protein